MDYTQTHSVNLSTADCNKIVKDSLNYNLAGVTKTETVPNVFEYLDISATAGSFFHPRKPQKLTIKLEPIDDNATSVTIKTEPRQPVSDYEYNDWNKELIQLGNTVWQNFLTAARNKLGELALAVNNIEPFDEPKKREENTEQTTEATTVSQSAQPTSPELQPIQSNADIAVSATAQAENTKIDPKKWWIIGGIVAAIIIFIIAVSGGSASEKGKYIGTTSVRQYGRSVTIETVFELKSGNKVSYTATNLNTGEIVGSLEGSYKFVGQTKTDTDRPMLITFTDGYTEISLNCLYTRYANVRTSFIVTNSSDYPFIASSYEKQ